MANSVLQLGGAALLIPQLVGETAQNSSIADLVTWGFEVAPYVMNLEERDDYVEVRPVRGDLRRIGTSLHLNALALMDMEQTAFADVEFINLVRQYPSANFQMLKQNHILRDILCTAAARDARWASGIQIEEMVRSSIESARKTGHFDEESDGYVQWCALEQRRVHGIVPLRLDNPKDLEVAQKYLVERLQYHGFEPVGGEEEVSKLFEAVVDEFKKRGTLVYYFDTGLEPKNLVVWSEIFRNPLLNHLEFSALEKLFKFLRRKKLSNRLLEQIATHPMGPELCLRAVRFGYTFPEALEYCLQSEDPLGTASILEVKIEKFRCSELMPEPDLLTEEDKIALCAAFHHTALLSGKHVQFPLFRRFQRDLHLFAELQKMFPSQQIPFYVFKVMCQFDYRIDPQRDKKPQAALFSVYDILRVFYSRRQSLKLSDDLLGELHFTLSHGSAYLLQSLYQLAVEVLKNQFQGDVARKLQFLIRASKVLKGEMAVPSSMPSWVPQTRLPLFTTTLNKILNHPDSHQVEEDFFKYVAMYQKNPAVEKEWIEMGDAEQLAVYWVVAEIYFGLPVEQLDFPGMEKEFYLIMEMESRRSKMSEKIIHLQDIAGLIHEIVPGFEIFLKDSPVYRALLRIVEGFEWGFAPLEQLERIRSGLRYGSPSLNEAFVNSLKRSSETDEKNAALELYEKGIDIGDFEKLFERYVRTPGRKARLEQNLEELAARVVQNPNYFKQALEDPFGVMSLRHVLGNLPVSCSWLLSMLVHAGTSRVAECVTLNESPVSIRVRRFKFTPPTKDEEYVALADAMGKHAEKIAMRVPPLDQILCPLIGRTDIPSLNQALGRVRRKRLQSLLKNKPHRLSAIAKWIIQRWLASVKQPLAVLEQLVLAYTKYNSRELSQKILNYHQKYPTRDDRLRASFNEKIEILFALHEFYSDRAKTLLGNQSALTPAIAKAQEELEGVYDTIVKKRDPGGDQRVMFVPGRTPLDAFSAWIAGNCLFENPHYRTKYLEYALTDPHFVPYRIAVDGKWRGTIMTFSYEVVINGQKRKILTLCGIDPQMDLNIDPDDFIEKTEKVFAKIAKEGKYDLVLIPKNEGLRSSRRLTISPAIARRYHRLLILSEDQGLRIVKLGRGNTPQDYYTSKEPVTEFLVMADLTAHTSKAG